MPARKLHPYELEQESIKTAQFQDYVPENASVASVKEVLFFVNIACFCVFLAIFSFLFLSLKVNTVLSFALAIGLSLVALQFHALLSRKNSNKNLR